MSDTLPCGHPTACDLPTIGCGWCDCRRELADTVSSLVRCERERDAEPASKVLATAQYQSLRIEASRLREELAAVQGRAAAMREALECTASELDGFDSGKCPACELKRAPTGPCPHSFCLSHRWRKALDGIAGRELQAELERLREFKLLVHRSLDDTGVPACEGAPCRVAARLAWLDQELERLRARVAELEAGEKAAEQKQADAVKAVVAMLALPTVVELEAADHDAMQLPENPMVLVPRADWDARPQWRDRPTCVGWWVQDITGMVGRRVFHVPAGELDNPLYYSPTRGVSYYGPIPAPEDKQ